nr:verprolin-like [Populus alba]
MRGTPPRHTSDHKAPHVPPVENGSEAQNQSKVKDEPTPTPTLAQLRLCCPCPSRRYLISLRTTITTTIPTIDPPPLPPALPLTTTITIPIPAPPTPPPPTTTTPPAPPTPPPPTTITITTPALHSPFIPGLEAQNQSEGKGESRLQQSAQAQSNEETTEWALLITSVLLEAMSAVFDQVGHALTGMVIAFLALFFSSLDFIFKARKEGVQSSQPFGGLLEYFGLAAAVWQCFNSTMGLDLYFLSETAGYEITDCANN